MGTLKWQLSQLGNIHRLEEVLRETAQVRKDLGYPIMATPASQFIVAQATMNVLGGGQYKNICDEIIQKSVAEYAVKPPGPIDTNLMDKIMSLPRTAELLNAQHQKPSIEELRHEIGEDLSDDEFLLRLVVPEEYIIAARAAGPMRLDYLKEDKPVLTLIQELMQSKKRHIHIKKKDLSLTLKRNIG
jgi:oxaloacetate decarboxylase alpha subunit